MILPRRRPPVPLYEVLGEDAVVEEARGLEHVPRDDLRSGRSPRTVLAAISLLAAVGVLASVLESDRPSRSARRTNRHPQANTQLSKPVRRARSRDRGQVALNAPTVLGRRYTAPPARRETDAGDPTDFAPVADHSAVAAAEFGFER